MVADRFGVEQAGGTVPDGEGRAISLLLQTIEKDPADAQACDRLGLALSGMQLDKFALLYFDRAIGLRPEFAQAYNNRGLALGRLGQYDASIRDLERAIALEPGFAEAHVNLGDAFCLACRHDEALDCYDRAIAADPELAEAYRQRSVVLLARGDFESGWVLYEWRMKAKIWGVDDAPAGKPAWTGRGSGQRLLVRKEQGAGEQILFGTLLPELAARVQDVTVSIDPRLIPLFERSFAGLKFVSKDEPVPGDAFDEHIRIGSLGPHFRRSAADFARARQPALRSRAAFTAELKGRLRGPGKLACGLSWSSRSDLGGSKSLTLRQLLPVLQVDGCDFVDLQYGDTSAERAELERECGIRIRKFDDIDNLQDLDGLASLTDACDLVITVSNTAAHLAGALGKPTWLLAPYGSRAIWYWSSADGRCLWYPSMTVFRQHAPGDWSGCLEEVRSRLKAMP